MASGPRFIVNMLEVKIAQTLNSLKLLKDSINPLSIRMKWRKSLRRQMRLFLNFWKYLDITIEDKNRIKLQFIKSVLIYSLQQLVCSRVITTLSILLGGGTLIAVYFLYECGELYY